jgi:hypothetical protein
MEGEAAREAASLSGARAIADEISIWSAARD